MIKLSDAFKPKYGATGIEKLTTADDVLTAMRAGIVSVSTKNGQKIGQISGQQDDDTFEVYTSSGTYRDVKISDPTVVFMGMKK